MFSPEIVQAINSEIERIESLSSPMPETCFTVWVLHGTRWTFTSGPHKKLSDAKKSVVALLDLGYTLRETKITKTKEL